MRRENILNGKYFIGFSRVESSGTARPELPRFCGKVIEETADGWFYVEVYGTGDNVTERRIMAVGELAVCLFYDERGFRDARSRSISRSGKK